MPTYIVKTGLNLGPQGQRFEPDSTIEEAELKRLCDEEAVEWLLARGHVEVKRTTGRGKRGRTGGSRSASTEPSSSAGSDSEEGAE